MEEQQRLPDVGSRCGALLHPSGRYITVTRWADGSYHPNFRPMPMREDLTLERYALGVYNELCMALGGLVEENDVRSKM